MQKKILKVTNISIDYPVRTGNFFFKKYSNLKAIDSVTFSIDSSETLGLVGESGCGKSSLARAIIRLVSNTKGSVSWLGKDYLFNDKNIINSFRKDVQFVFQDPLASLNPRMTASEIISEPLENYKPELNSYERETLVKDGAIFRTTSDTETIVQLIAKSKRDKIVDKLIDTLFQIKGGYALVLMTNKKLIGARDPFGIRPLVIGKLKDSFILASETCALDIVGASFVREVENGEIIVVENNKINSIQPFPKQKARPCIFEYIYFARPDSLIDGKCAYEYRKNFGIQLAKEADIKADIVVPVPDSGVPAALGYAEYSKKKFELGLIRNHYVGRTFIEPTQHIRSLGVKLKLSSTKSIVKNKSIILIDDSLVRGTTCLKIVKMLYESGAKEVHVRIACPEIKFPDFYGVDMPTKKELLAHNKDNKEMCEYINAKSLKFLSLDGLYEALNKGKRNNTYPQFSDHYFTGDYPVKPSDNLGEEKIKQLSLLSSKSSN